MAEKKNTFQLKIIAPDRLFFEGEADMLEFTTTEGDMGIYAGHMSSAVILVPCRINIHADGKVRSLMASGGFIEILPDKVTVMAEDTLWPDEIDVERAEGARDRARKRLDERGEGVDLIRAEAALKRALVRLEVASLKGGKS